MNVLRAAFARNKAFVGYMTAGDGEMEECVDAALALIRGGVNLLEIGLPFSDPIADGPVIQAAMQRALQRGTTPETVCKFITKLRKQTNVPMVLFTYYNPILQRGEKYLYQLRDAGIEGILTVDLPLEEASLYFELMKDAQLTPVLIATPSTPTVRLQQIKEMSQGFIYYVCRKGTTGHSSALPEGYAEKIAEIKRNSEIPVAAGFGIGKREHAAEALQHADGVVIGSSIVEKIGQKISPEALEEYVRSLDPRFNTNKRFPA